MNVDGNGVRKLTRNPADDSDPAWSPDGRSIVFASNRDGNSEVYVMNADGSQQRRLTRDAAGGRISGLAQQAQVTAAGKGPAKPGLFRFWATLGT